MCIFDLKLYNNCQGKKFSQMSTFKLTLNVQSLNLQLTLTTLYTNSMIHLNFLQNNSLGTYPHKNPQQLRLRALAETLLWVVWRFWKAGAFPQSEVISMEDSEWWPQCVNFHRGPIKFSGWPSARREKHTDGALDRQSGPSVSCWMDPVKVLPISLFNRQYNLVWLQGKASLRDL